MKSEIVSTVAVPPKRPHATQTASCLSVHRDARVVLRAGPQLQIRARPMNLGFARPIDGYP